MKKREKDGEPWLLQSYFEATKEPMSKTTTKSIKLKKKKPDIEFNDKKKNAEKKNSKILLRE